MMSGRYTVPGYEASKASRTFDRDIFLIIVKGLSPFRPVTIIKNISQLNVHHGFQASYPKHDTYFSRFTDTHFSPFWMLVYISRFHL